jgi:hypothetical protein
MIALYTENNNGARRKDEIFVKREAHAPLFGYARS